MTSRTSRLARLMPRLVRLASVALVSVACATAMPACELLGSSKVAQGQRFQSDDPRYDPYFDSVHQAQVAAAAWPDEKKAARRPLLTALALTPDSSDATILDATEQRAKKSGGGKLDLASAHITSSSGAGDAALFAAVEETVRLELDRARKLKDKSEKLDEMSKHGEELKKSAETETFNRGADKADEKKNEKNREIRRELYGAVDSTRNLSQQALRQSKYAQQFLDDLGDAVEASNGPRKPHDRLESRPLPPAPPPKAEPPKADEKKPEEPKSGAGKPKPGAGKPKAAAPPTDKPAPADKPTPPPADKPAPKPAAPPDEVFNP
jgi:hypothetical protein